MRFLYCFAITVIVFSCNTYQTKYPYSLKDFRPELRSHLENIIINGGMCGSFDDENDNTVINLAYRFLLNKADDMELQKLVSSEHPLLRAYAFNILCIKKSDKINKLLLSHLDDTAMVTYCAGEFGPLNTTVADYFIEESRGKTALPKTDLIGTVITEHPYLVHAATFFTYETVPNDKYYTILKKIIQNKYPLHYNYQNQLITRLSKFKQEADTAIIKSELKKRWKNEDDKYILIEDNPSPAFFFMIEKFFSRLLGLHYRKLLQLEYIKNEQLEGALRSFISAAASYRSKRSAEILGEVLHKKLFPVNYNTHNRQLDFWFHYTLFQALERYDCSFYKELKKEIETKAKVYRKKYTLDPLENYDDSLSIEKSVNW